MTALFHASPWRHLSGAVIAAGHYGRMVDTPAHFHHEREMLLHAARCDGSPDRPSRLKALLACPTEAGLRRYVDQMCMRHAERIAEHMYEIEVLDADRPMHRGDWRIPQHRFHEQI